MGCIGSKEADEEGFGSLQPPEGQRTKAWKKPKSFISDEELTEEQLKRKREEFWDTQPHYGGDKVIWDALKAACEAEDDATARLIIETAGIIVAAPDMSICYDERGAKYDLPKYVLCNPSNLQHS